MPASKYEPGEHPFEKPQIIFGMKPPPGWKHDSPKPTSALPPPEKPPHQLND